MGLIIRTGEFLLTVRPNARVYKGVLVCGMQVVIVIYFAGIVVLSIIGLTAYRFLIIIYRFHMSEKVAIISIGCIWAVLAVVIAIFVGSGALQFIGVQHGTYCFLLSNSTELVAEVGSSLVVFCLLMPAIILPIAYFMIIRVYMSRKKDTKNETSLVDSAEWKLIKLACAITASYWFTWTPFTIKLLWELITHQPVPIEYEVVASFLAVTDPLANTVVVLIYDAKIYREVIDLFGLQRYFFGRQQISRLLLKGREARERKLKEVKLQQINVKPHIQKTEIHELNTIVMVKSPSNEQLGHRPTLKK